MTLINIIGIGASICTATSLLPQLIKIWREKKANDISFYMLGVLFAGVALWIYYGILKNDMIIVIANSVSLLLNIAIVLLSIRYKQER
jgi:MtN3 and saliva related transmembrane protein